MTVDSNTELAILKSHNAISKILSNHVDEYRKDRESIHTKLNSIEAKVDNNGRRHDIANGRVAKIEGRLEMLEKADIAMQTEMALNDGSNRVYTKWMDRAWGLAPWVLTFLLGVAVKLDIINL